MQLLIDQTLKWASLAIPTLFTVFGWLVIVGNSKRLARRSEVNMLLNDVYTAIRSLRKDALRSWKDLGPTDVLPEHLDYLLVSHCSDIEHGLHSVSSYYFEHGIDLRCVAKLRRVAGMPECFLIDQGIHSRNAEIQHSTSEIIFSLRASVQRHFKNKATKP